MGPKFRHFLIWIASLTYQLLKDHPDVLQAVRQAHIIHLAIPNSSQASLACGWLLSFNGSHFQVPPPPTPSTYLLPPLETEAPPL